MENEIQHYLENGGAYEDLSFDTKLMIEAIESLKMQIEEYKRKHHYENT